MRWGIEYRFAIVYVVAVITGLLLCVLGQGFLFCYCGCWNSDY